MKRYERAAAYVDLDAILYNLKGMLRALKPGTELIAVIKTNGYGHGAVEIARVSENVKGLWGFAVATAEEALELRENGVKKPILILGYTFPESYPDLVREEIRLAVFREDQARLLSEEGIRQGKKAFAHLAVDTGMGRIGVRPDPESLDSVLRMMTLPGILPEGIFTHFARADESDCEPTERQIRLFTDYIAACEAAGLHFRYKHCSNSAGIVLYPDANLDLVRAGITLYGLRPSNEVPEDIIVFHSALELKSHIVYIKYIGPGEAVSYGGTYTAAERRRVATIPVGYGDGYPRRLSGQGTVLIRGRRAPILGRICMDQFMVDVTDIPGASEGDEVTLIGSDGKERITMEELGDLSGRFNYELACDLGKRIPRIYLRNGQAVSVRE